MSGAIMIFGGLQSLLFYTSMTWLPTMAVQAGLSKDLDYLPPCSPDPSPFSLTIPSLTTRLSDRNRRLMLTIVVGAGILGVAMLLIPTSNFYWLVINALIGSSVSSLFPYLMVAFMKSSTPERQLNFLVLPKQEAAVLLLWSHPLRYSKSLFHSWTPAILMLLVLTIVMVIALYQVEKSIIFLTIDRLEDSSSGFLCAKRTRL